MEGEEDASSSTTLSENQVIPTIQSITSEEPGSNNNGMYRSKSESPEDDGALAPENLLLAATLIKDAVAGRNLSFKTDVASIRSYTVYKHVGFKIALYVCLWGYMLLAICEKPAVSGLKLPYWGTMIVEGVFLIFFAFRLGHNARFDDPMTFWRDPKNLVVLFTILLAVCDIVSYCVWVNVATTTTAALAIRWSRPLRPLLIINFPEGRQLRKAFRNIRRTLPDIVYVLVLFIASIALFSLLALKLLQKRGLHYPDARPYFVDYWDSFWDLYVMVTTANDPDVMMPAYDYNNWFALFFVAYLIINLYVFMNIVLAVIYNNYKRHLKNEVKASVYQKRRLLARAFTVLRVRVGEDQVVSGERWRQVMTLVCPGRSALQLDLLLFVLDDNGDGSIAKKEFLKVADLMNIELSEVKRETTDFKRCCGQCYVSHVSEIIKMAIRTRYFQWFFDLLILANAVCIGLGIDEAEWFFMAAFTLEIVLRFYAHGFRKYFSGFWNVFDFIVIGLAWVVTIVGYGIGQSDIRMSLLDVLMVLRILRLIRLAGSIERFRVILTTIVNIGPSVATYGTVIFVLYYIYAIIGMEVFGGRIRFHGYEDSNETVLLCGNPLLNGSEFAQRRYCSNNFNNILHSFVLLFELMVVNQWHILTEGFVLVTNKAARLYFISFHMFCVVVLLNIFTAFVLEVFILEFTLSKSKLESVVETRIKEMGLGIGQKPKVNFSRKADKAELVDNMEEAESHTTTDAVAGSTAAQTSSPDGAVSNSEATPPAWASDNGGLRFRLRHKARKRVEVLLQLMFEGEIDPADEGDVYEATEQTDEMVTPVLDSVV